MHNATPNPTQGQGLFLSLLRSVADCGGDASDDILLAKARGGLESLLNSQCKAAAGLLSMLRLLDCLAMNLPPGATVYDAEQLTRWRANDLLNPLDTAHCQEALDAAGRAAAGHVVCPIPGCGSRAHSLGVSGATFKGAFGDVKLSFARYQCQLKACGHRFEPARMHCGLAGRARLLPGCADMVTYAATVAAYGKATELLEKMCRIEVSEHAMQDAVEERGAVVVELHVAEGERHRPHTDDGKPLVVRRPTDCQATAPEVAYAAIDGVYAMVRTKDEARSSDAQGARGGKNARYDVEGAEIKNAVLWTDADRVQEAPTRGWHVNRHIVSHLGPCGAFLPLLWVAMLRLRFDQAKVLVVLSDGAHWIRDLFLHLPMAAKPILILDFYHVVLRVRETLRAVHGDGSEEYKRLSECWIGSIRAGHAEYVLNDLKELAAKHESARELAGYITNNLDRMKYDQWEARGLQISSAPVESANYHVTGARLKQQGMRWTRKAANEMATLRADQANGHWERRTRQLIRRAA
jgi:hypothetical protein